MIRISTTTQRLEPLSLIDAFILEIYRRADSIAAFFMGRRDTGKSDHALYTAEILYKYQVMNLFATNIRVYSTPGNMKIDRITDLYNLERWAEGNAGRKLYILDEFGKAARRRTPMSKLNIKILDKLQILRKYKLSWISIAPAEKYVDSASLGSDVLDYIVLKPKFNDPKIADYYDVMRQISKGFKKLPRTSIHFDTWDIAPFTLEPEKIIDKFPTKAIEYSYKNAKYGLTAKALGLDKKQLNRYYKQTIRYFCEKYLTVDKLSE